MTRYQLNEILWLLKYIILFSVAICTVVLTCKMAFLQYKITKNKVWIVLKTCAKFVVMFYTHIVLAICDETLFLEVFAIYNIITYIVLKIKKLEVKMKTTQ